MVERSDFSAIHMILNELFCLRWLLILVPVKVPTIQRRTHYSFSSWRLSVIWRWQRVILVLILQRFLIASVKIINDGVYFAIVLWCLRILVVWWYRILCTRCDNILIVSIGYIWLKLSRSYWSTYIWLEISHVFTARWCVGFSQCSFPRIRPLIILFGQFMLDLLLCLDKLSVFHQTLMLCLFDSFHYTVELSLGVWSWFFTHFFVIWIPLLSLLLSTWGFRLFLLFDRILLGSVFAFDILRISQRLIDLR